MVVGKLEIKGFRGVREASVGLTQLTAFVGPNNCGKTTLIEALALVLGRDRLVRTLTEHDFWGSDPRETDRINIIATLTGFEGDDPARHGSWFRWGRGTMKWFDQQTLELKPERTLPSDKLACQIAFCARFDRESLETITTRYFYDGQLDPFADGAIAESVPPDLIRQIGFFLVPASRTWDRTISFGSELFRRVVTYVAGRPAAAVLEERSRLRHPEHPLEQDPNLEELVGHIDEDLASLLGTRTGLKLRVTSTDSEGILDAVFPHFATEDGIALPSRRHGSGLISLQTIVLLMRFGQLRAAAGDGFLLAIEEPELHVPPPMQRKLVRMIQSMATQTIVTTHSTTVAAVPDPHQIRIVENHRGSLRATPVSKVPLTADAQNQLRSLLLVSRETTIGALMHPAVLVPEGRLDMSWLRLFTRAVELANNHETSFGHEVGVIPTAEAKISDTFQHLSAIHAKVCCLVDGDAEGRVYTTSVCALASPPHAVIRWPDGWTIESVIGWVAAADPQVLASPELAQFGIPQNPDTMGALLRDRNGRLKTDEVAHSALADAIGANERCVNRLVAVLQFLADAASGRQIAPERATAALDPNGVTTVWTFNHAVHGL